ncbi:MAG: ATP-dependent DNA helicase RecG [Chloroflexi bacterium]|nr:ATP-dependent DNA helicase RecG [Chloroflexota bacterium]
MAVSKQDSSAWPDRLRNILKLEESRGFDDHAVVGGLDRFLQHWAGEMAGHLKEPALVRQLTGSSYASMSAEERRRWSERWREVLQNGPAEAPGGVSTVPEHTPKTTAASSRTATAKKPSALKVSPKVSPEEAAGKGHRSLPAGVTVDGPVSLLRGVDVKLSARLKRLDVNSVRDLLYLFPRRHQDYSEFTKISELAPGQECTVIANIWEVREVTGGRQGKRKDTEAVIGDATGNLKVIWFGQRYLARSLKPNARIAVSGKPTVFRGQLVLESPDYEILDDGQASIHTGRMVPIYPLTEGLTGRNLRRITWQALQEWLGGIDELLPADIRKRTGLVPLQQAIRQAHYPDAWDSWESARRRLAFDELFTLQLAVLRRRQHQREDVKGVAIPAHPEALQGFLKSLPFELTPAQHRCVREIISDLEQGTPPMNRLLQGEVGSGKTVVALAALLQVAAADYQGAIMVPTEVLAEQHFQTIAGLLSGKDRPVQSDYLVSVYLEALGRPVSVGLLTGSTRQSRKRELREMAAAGTLDLIIGTQALIQAGVSLPKLALAVTDEQHRFGVLQRSALRHRGEEPPHALLMSATPIPRTLTLTLYGDLDISTIDELPAGRQEVSTRWLSAERRPAAYGFLRKQVQDGRQAFVICPLVEESEVIDAKAATDEYERLSRDIFPDLNLGLLHGRMSPKDKDKVMRRFREGETDILISTAVVEVGIDVANATVMLIEGADRFGLAQLHQFRGRVGRGEHKSYCILLSDTQSDVAKERLSALEQIHDGFQLAEVDLELRGPGDFFGTRQSGLPNLRMAQLSDRQLLESAREEAARVMEKDPELKSKNHAGLRAQVARLLDTVSEEAS